MKSKQWLERQKKDYFVKKAKNHGYISRASYKLIEIENKFKFINSSKFVLELGSSPGGWTQVAFEVNEQIKMFAFDLIDMKYNNPKLKFYKEDFLKFDLSKLPCKFDLIISDIAPNTTGHQSTDHLRISSIIEEIIFVLDDLALPSSNFIFKIWKGSEELKIIKLLKKKYKKIHYFKPKSSRSESSEIYIVAQQFIN